VLDRLERVGYIRRRPDAADRRRLVVEATAATAARDREVFGDLIRQTGEVLATYTDDQLAVIDDFLTRARHLTAAYADTLSGRHGSAATGQPPSADEPAWSPGGLQRMDHRPSGPEIARRSELSRRTTAT
jgi:hypothetical protein